jgi:hypothetical protein
VKLKELKRAYEMIAQPGGRRIDGSISTDVIRELLDLGVIMTGIMIIGGHEHDWGWIPGDHYCEYLQGRAAR